MTMFCPRCGAENAETNRFCLTCGAALETKPMPPITPPPRPQSPVASAATTGGFAGIIGGTLAVIGWLMPWFGIGAGFGNPFGGLGGVSLGTGSGLQLFIATLAAVFASLNSRSTGSVGGLIVLIAFVLALVLITIPILGIVIARTGVKIAEKRSSSSEQDVSAVVSWISQLRTRSAAGFILMAVIYILVSLIPFLSALLGTGFFVTSGAFALVFLSALFAKSQAGPS
jgi:hypothetical protein